MRDFLNESNRIKELMKFQIQPYNGSMMINEGPGDKVIDDILLSLLPNFKKVYKNIDTKVFDDILTTVKQSPSKTVRSDLKNITTVDGLLANLDSFSDETLLNIFKQLTSKGISEIDDLVIKSMADILADSTATEFVQLAKVYNTVDEFIAFLQSGATEPFPEYMIGILKRFYAKEVLNAFGPGKKYIVSNLKKLQKAANRKGGVTWFKDTLKVWLKETSELRSEIVSLSDEFIERMDLSTDPTKQRTLIDAYAVAISRVLNKLEMKGNQLAAKSLSELDISPELKSVIQNNERDTFKIFREIRNEDPTSNFAVSIVETISEFVRRNTPSFEFNGPFKKISEYLSNVKSKSIGTTPSASAYNKGGKWITVNWPQDMSTYLVSGQWSTLSRAYKTAVKNSAADSTGAASMWLFRGLVYSEFGLVLAHVFYDVGAAILSTMEVQLKVNKVFAAFGAEPPYPNAQQEADEEFSSGIMELTTKIGRNMKETFLGGGVAWAIPYIGTFEKSFASKMTAYFSGNPTGYSVGEIWKVIKGLLDDLWDGVKGPLNIETSDTTDITTDTTTDITTDTTTDQVRELLPEKYRENVYRKESGDIYLEWEGMTYPIEKKDNIFWIYLEGHESPYKLEDIEF
jgi:hypothetical protein